MAKIVFFRCPDGAVCEERRHAMPAEAPDFMVAVDPGVHALPRTEFGPWRTQLHGDDGILAG
jgi:hypothetical protein